eukprot:COSAG06_NODE_1016_length_11063_cov_3.146922_12_plen_50_part_00
MSPHLRLGGWRSAHTLSTGQFFAEENERQLGLVDPAAMQMPGSEGGGLE